MADLTFDGLNLVAEDVEATLAFYRRLGVEIPETAVWRTDTGPHHVQAPVGDADVDIDSRALAAAYNQGFDPNDPVARTLIGFRVATRDAVDSLYAELTGAGAAGLQEPHDAFWGARYAIVRDPDGRSVGFMSPIDPSKRSAPPQV